MKTLSRTLVYRLALAFGLVALAAPAIAEESESYGYVRVVEGSASVVQAGTSERASAEVNQPVLAGDRISVPNRSRVEVVLADRNILRVDGGSELVLERLAASPDRSDRATVVRLLEGNLQLVVTQDSLGDELPRIETPNASIYPQYYGVYRITADHDGWSQLVVRRGTAEVVTDRDRATVKADQELVIDERADRDEELAEAVREAGGYDAVERWARQLDDDYSGSDLRYVDDNLRYQATPLARYGEWVDYEGAAYWRPRVEAGWRPYFNGRWVYLPSGLTWVSSEPWGWVPYHYGSWDFLPVYGWVWRPGYVWSPAWVYWYWGPDYVGWCPTGYYTRYYSARLGVDFGFRFGVYGYAGGDWSYFDHWNFVNTSYFDYRNGYRDGYWDGRRDVRRYAVPVDSVRNARKPLGRGIITTDTKPLRPSTWRNPDSVRHALQNGRGAVGELPDVTPFIARKPALPPNVQRTVQAENPAVLEGTPLRPGTLGKPARDTRGNRPGRDGVLGATPGAGNGRNPDHAPATGPVVKPGRPSIEVGGGAPNPRNSGNPGDRTGREPEIHGAQPDSQGGGRPGVRERPGRPAPEADGGAPRPDRQPAVIEAKPNRNDRNDRPERQPATIEVKPEVKPNRNDDRQQPPARQPERQPSNDDRPSRTEQPRTNDRPSSNDNDRARDNDRNRDNGRPPANEDKPERKPPAQSQELYRPQRPTVQPEGERQPKPAPQVYRAPEPQRAQPAPQRPAEVKPAPQQPQRQEPQRSKGDDDGNGRRRDNDRKPPLG